MHRIFIVLVGSWIVIGSLAAQADPLFNSHFNKYMVHIEKNGTPVFFSQCIIFENKNTRVVLQNPLLNKNAVSHSIIVRRAAILVPVGQSKGLFLYAGKISVVNMATLSWKGHLLKVDGLFGGIYTFLKMDSLINDLLSSRYSLVPAERLNEILHMQTRTACSLKKFFSVLRKNPLL